jgi:hypothetical protein
LNFQVCLGVLISLVYLFGMLIFLAIVKNASIVRHSLTVTAITAAFVLTLHCFCEGSESVRIKKTVYRACFSQFSLARTDVLIQMCDVCPTGWTTRRDPLKPNQSSNMSQHVPTKVYKSNKSLRNLPVVQARLCGVDDGVQAGMLSCTKAFLHRLQCSQLGSGTAIRFLV